jgi:hypothetical protein
MACQRNQELDQKGKRRKFLLLFLPSQVKEMCGPIQVCCSTFREKEGAWNSGSGVTSKI